MITYTYDNEILSCPDGTTYLDLAKLNQDKYEHEILLASANERLCELTKTVEDGAQIKFITGAQAIGSNVYDRSALFLFLSAFYDMIGQEHIDKVQVHFSVRRGLLIEAKFKREDLQIDHAMLEKLQAKMQKMVEARMPITKKTISVREAEKLFEKQGMADKVQMLHFRRFSVMNVYTLGNLTDYFYGYMVPDTGYLKYFDLCLYQGYIILKLPSSKNPEFVPEFEEQPKLYGALLRSVKWGRMMNANTIGELNQEISMGNVDELMLVQEALMEKQLGDIAEEIADNRNIKFVMIAGPSSSGKTTTSRRLSIQLKALGLKPHPISVDNYFVSREDTPRDENGDYDYECLEALDLKLFNQNMKALLEGKRVELPTFNFVEGRKEFKGDFLQIGPDDVLVIEGIHALNKRMSEELPEESKFKIYLSAMTTLNIDEHNRIPTTDGRLIRRMIRDARTRGTSAQETIKRWPSVRAGEEKNIFPYQEEANVVFNSSLIYELPVLKTQAEALLFQVPEESPEGVEAKRLLKFFDYCLAIGTDEIPKTSILREFVGGGCFDI